MLKYNIDDGSLLTEVKRYDLDRGSDLGYLRIEVHKVVAGSEKVGQFIAFPVQLLIGESDEKYSTEGKSEEEALTKCLNLIKGKPNDEIFGYPEETDETLDDSRD